jgi:hypothetical protein
VCEHAVEIGVFSIPGGWLSKLKGYYEEQLGEKEEITGHAAVQILQADDIYTDFLAGFNTKIAAIQMRSQSSAVTPLADS